MRIALIGDYSEDVTAHQAISVALQLEAQARKQTIEANWLHTAQMTDPSVLAGYDGGWVVPASPYADMDNALAAIRYFREMNKPFLGTCGGYQHALVEFARNVLGYKNAGISEVDPDCPMPLVSALTCALIEQAETVIPRSGGVIEKLAGSKVLSETYHCSFGLNPEYAHIFDQTNFAADAHDSNGAVRAMVLSAHPFFVGTAFQPERAALSSQRHPIISGFVEAASG